MNNERIYQFLVDHAIEVEQNEPINYVELMMDNHKCVEIDEKQFYIPEDILFYDSDDDNEVYDYLINNYSL